MKAKKICLAVSYDLANFVHKRGPPSPFANKFLKKISCGLKGYTPPPLWLCGLSKNTTLEKSQYKWLKWKHLFWKFGRYGGFRVTSLTPPPLPPSLCWPNFWLRRSLTNSIEQWTWCCGSRGYKFCKIVLDRLPYIEKNRNSKCSAFCVWEKVHRYTYFKRNLESVGRRII